MKKALLSILIASKLVLGGGIPVVDVTANSQMATQNAKEIAEWVEQASRWAEEITHYQSQLDAYNTELLSKTGIRDTVQFMKDVESFYDFAKNYKDDYLSLGTDILNSNTIIGNRAQALYDNYNLFDDCDIDYLTDDEKRICKNKMVRRVHEVAVYQEYSNNLGEISDNLSDLSNKLANSQDIKESQDIANAINMEVAKLELTKSQVELMNAQNARLDKIEEKQEEQLLKQSLRKVDDRDYSSAFGN